MTYSLDFRKHVLKVKEKEGLTFEETSERFAISIRSLFRWSQRLEPFTTHKKAPLKIDMDALAKHVEDFPDLYQKERAQHFGVTGPGILAALRRLGITNKKNTKTPQSQ